jgi:hypothetical protein
MLIIQTSSATNAQFFGLVFSKGLKNCGLVGSSYLIAKYTKSTTLLFSTVAHKRAARENLQRPMVDYRNQDNFPVLQVWCAPANARTCSSPTFPSPSTMSSSVYPSEVLNLVRSFLVDNGYSSTVAALDKELSKNVSKFI